MKNKRMYEDLCGMLEKELDTLTKKGDITSEDLTHIDKLTHSIKSISTIVAMEEAKENGGSYDGRGGYSRNNSYDGGYGNSRDYSRGSYGSYDDGMSNEYSREYSRDNSYDVSYARRGRDGDGDGRYNESRYSRDASKDRIINKLEMLKNDAMNNEDKMHIEKLIHSMRAN